MVMKVGELIEALRRYPADLPVGAQYDSRAVVGDVVSVELGDDADGLPKGAVLLIVSDEDDIRPAG